MFEDVGNWKRARYFPRPARTCTPPSSANAWPCARGVGLFDASTLGKIDLQGKDCAEFLNRVYTNAWTKLEVGRCRYGLMLREDGMVFDDGVTARLGPGHFHMTTTTGGAPRVLAWLEEWLQTEWPELEVYCTSVTEQWAAIAVVGPRRATCCARPGPTWTSPTTALPAPRLPRGHGRRHPSAGVPDQLLRRDRLRGQRTLGLWRGTVGGAVGGRPAHRITAYGTEAMHVLRAEKGYIIVGQDTDGTATPFDLGMDWIVSKAKPDFLGKRGLQQPAVRAAGRKQLVGLLTGRPGEVLEEGAQIVADAGARSPPVPMIGHVTSSYLSPNVGRSIAMAMVRGRPWAARADRLCPMPGRVIAAKIDQARVLRSRGSSPRWLSPPAPARLAGLAVAERAIAGPAAGDAHRTAVSRQADPARRRSRARTGGGSAGPGAARDRCAAAGRAVSAALWLGPDEWLVLLARGDGEQQAAALRAKLAGCHHAVVG